MKIVPGMARSSQSSVVVTVAVQGAAQQADLAEPVVGAQAVHLALR